MKKEDTKIFIVEDDKFYAQLIQTYLKGIGYWDSTVFYTGTDCIKNMDKNPRIIVLDYTLGLENGIETLKSIKQFDETNHVIMLSGQEYLHISVKAYRYGACDYIEKDRDSLRNLEKSIEKILDRDGLVSSQKPIF